jgi:hypothetical protein
MERVSLYAMGRMKDMLPKVQQLQRDTAGQLKAAGDAADATPPRDEAASCAAR